MEKITKVTEADVGRIAVSLDGKAKFDLTEEYRVRIVAVPSDPHNTPIQYLREDGSVKHDVVNFGLVRGAVDMYWEDEVQAEQKVDKEQVVGIWFEPAVALEKYSLDQVKDVIRQSFDAAPNRPTAWEDADHYFRNWEDSLTTPGEIVGLDREGSFDGWNFAGLRDYSDDKLLSFEDFCERLGLDAPSIAEGGAPEFPVQTVAVEPTTPFTTWCKKKGYDTEGKFTYLRSAREEWCSFSKDAVLELIYDDGTCCPRFQDEDGNSFFEYFDSAVEEGYGLKQAVTGVAKPRFRKKRQKPAVRQKTSIVIFYKTGERYTIKRVNGIALNRELASMGNIQIVEKGIRVHTSNTIDTDLIKSLVIQSPQGDVTLINYGEQGWFVSSPTSHSLCTEWSHSF